MGIFKLNGIDYMGGGGGSSVIPNPQDPATDTLITVGINGTVYNITGGGSGYEETVLWSGTQDSTGEGVSILLSDDISNYDAIIIDCGRQSGSAYRHGYVWYPVSDLYTGLWYLQIINTNDNCTAYWEYASNTSITWASAYSAYPVTLFSIKGVNFGGGYQFQPVIYSTEEREIGVWADGKPLYQTTIHTGALTKDGNWHSIAHNISNIDKIILCTGTVYAADNTAYPMPNYRPGLTQGICLDATTTNIEYIQNWLDSSPDSYVTLQYTKTTDQPGSGTWTPQGVPAVHYSTDEQVVGTWVDGSTLYEKTLTFTSPNVTGDDSTSDLVHGVSNIDVAWVETALYKSVNQGIPRYQNVICGTKFASSDRTGEISTWEVGDRSIYSLTTTYSSLGGREFVFVIRYTKSTS